MGQVMCVGRVTRDLFGRGWVVRRHVAPEGTWYCKGCDRTVYRGLAARRLLAEMRRRYGS